MNVEKNYDMMGHVRKLNECVFYGVGIKMKCMSEEIERASQTTVSSLDIHMMSVGGAINKEEVNPNLVR